MVDSSGNGKPWALETETDPYLESMAAFTVPAVHPSVAEILKESELNSSLFNPQRYRGVSLIDYYGLHLAIDLIGRLEICKILEETRTVDELVKAKQFVPDFQAPLRWVLERLAAAEILLTDQIGDERGYWLGSPLRSERLEWLYRQALEIDSDIVPTLDLMKAAADAYPKVAHGEISGERFLWQSLKLWSKFLNKRNWYYDLNNQVASRAAAERLPAGGIQALEVGAGFGSGTRSLLEALAQRNDPEALTFYRATEPDPFVRRRLQQSLESAGPVHHLEFAGLDIDNPWTDQGCEIAQFSLVFAVNVFHLAQDLDFSLSEAFRVLAPGGWLILGEGLRPFHGQPIAIELVFQLLRDFVDVKTCSMRSTHGFLCPEEWQQLLDKAGFQAVEVVPDLFRLRYQCPRFCFGAICGRKPEETH